jgi:hypothetical protein
VSGDAVHEGSCGLPFLAPGGLLQSSTRTRTPRRYWTDDEIALLRDMYPECHAADVGAWLLRGMDQVYQAAAKHGLHKSAAYLASDTACRIQRGKQHPSMIASRFQPGIVPWNKGTHYVAGGRSGETRFKRGRKPEESRNYLPIGSLRVCADGYLERKFTDDQSIVPARRWVAVHRLVWEASVGPIPKGHIVRFRDRMKTTVLEEITVDRLECITRAEHARRNHPRSHSPELARLVQLKGAITRQVNRITREAAERTSP